MAIFPQSFSGKDTLSPGARGERFNVNIPGHRNKENMVNRTNMKLATSEHDVPNVQYELDSRLPVVFTYGFAYGYNQVVLPKGRVVAVDKNVNQFSADTDKQYNILTLANGGSIVKFDNDAKQWRKVNSTVTIDEATKTATIKDENGKIITIDEQTGLVKVDGELRRDYIVGNRPMGIIMRNEYTRNDDAFNGMQPGAVLTDALVELPLFLDQEHAEKNPWGSAYGALLPGDFVKSDENGRIIPSPLNSAIEMEKAGLDTPAKIELERQQIVGQVLSINRDLVPAGAAKYAQWALSDRMKFDEFNPQLWRGNNRDGEDTLEHSPNTKKKVGTINSAKSTTGMNPYEYPGWPYDQTLTQNDLHMLASTARRSDLRFSLKDQLENGIPGLTDGYNAFVKEFKPEVIGQLHAGNSAAEYVPQHFQLSEVNVEKGSLMIAVTTKNQHTVTKADLTSVTAEGQELKITIGDEVSKDALLKIKYLDELQGIVVLEPSDPKKYHEFLTADKNKALVEAGALNVVVQFKKRGLAGVPTNLDWDGCQGVACILLQK